MIHFKIHNTLSVINRLGTIIDCVGEIISSRNGLIMLASILEPILLTTLDKLINGSKFINLFRTLHFGYEDNEAKI